MSESETRAAVLAGLDKLTQSDLQEVIKKAGAVLAAREKERRAEALREIQKIARAHGLSVDVSEGKRRPGRPAKPKAAS